MSRFDLSLDVLRKDLPSKIASKIQYDKRACVADIGLVDMSDERGYRSSLGYSKGGVSSTFCPADYEGCSESRDHDFVAATSAFYQYLLLSCSIARQGRIVGIYTAWYTIFNMAASTDSEWLWKIR